MPEEPWYTDFFGPDYLRIYRPYLTPDRTERETLGILRLLGLPPGSKILDLCCGHGRLAVPLATLGYEITGLDLSRYFLRRARAAAREVGAQVRWVHADMRQIPFEAEFDAVINIFTAFGYLESDAEDQRVLEQVSRALAPGGLFLIETANRDGVSRHFVSADLERHADGLLVLQEQEFEPLTSRLHALVTLIKANGERREYRHVMRVYTLTELAGMMAAASLEVAGYYGGLDGSRLELSSRRMAVLARKVTSGRA